MNEQTCINSKKGRFNDRLVQLMPALFSLISLASLLPAFSQVHKPVKWIFTSVPGTRQECTLKFTARMDEGWHLYSQFMEEGGPLPTTFTFSKSDAYSLIGKVMEEGHPVESFDSIFYMDIIWFNDSVVFSQKVKLNTEQATIKGNIQFMACTDEMCLPPDEVAFSFDLQEAKNVKGRSSSKPAVWPRSPGTFKERKRNIEQEEESNNR